MLEILCALRKEIVRIAWQGDPGPTIVINTVMLMCIGVFLLRPMDSFGSTKLYHYFESLPFGEVAWGWIFVGLGVVKLFVLGINALHTGRPHKRSLMVAVALNLLMALIYANMGLGIAASSPESWSYIVYAVPAISTFWCATRRYRHSVGGI